MDCNEIECGILRRVPRWIIFMRQGQSVIPPNNRDVMLMSTHDNFRMPGTTWPISIFFRLVDDLVMPK